MVTIEILQEGIDVSQHISDLLDLEIQASLSRILTGLFIVNARPIIPEHAYISRTIREISEDSDLNPVTHEAALITGLFYPETLLSQ